jgi:hypothetical protein
MLKSFGTAFSKAPNVCWAAKLAGAEVDNAAVIRNKSVSTLRGSLKTTALLKLLILFLLLMTLTQTPYRKGKQNLL